MLYSNIGRINFPAKEGSECFTFYPDKDGNWKTIQTTVKLRETTGRYKYLYQTMDYAEIALKIHLGKLKRLKKK